MTKRVRNFEIADFERNKELFTNNETLNNIKMNWKQKKVIPIGLIVLVDNNHTKTIRALFCMQQNGKIENVFTNQKNNIYYINVLYFENIEIGSLVDQYIQTHYFNKKKECYLYTDQNDPYHRSLGFHITLYEHERSKMIETFLSSQYLNTQVLTKNNIEKKFNQTYFFQRIHPNLLCQLYDEFSEEYITNIIELLDEL